MESQGVKRVIYGQLQKLDALPPSKAGFPWHYHQRNHVQQRKEIGFQNTCHLTHTLAYDTNNTALGLFGAMCPRDSKSLAEENAILSTSQASIVQTPRH